MLFSNKAEIGYISLPFASRIEDLKNWDREIWFSLK